MHKLITMLSGVIFASLIFLGLVKSDQNMEKQKLEETKVKITEELKKRTPLPEKIHNEQYGCSFNDDKEMSDYNGITPYEELMKCIELNKVELWQNKEGKFFFGLEKKDNLL